MHSIITQAANGYILTISDEDKENPTDTQFVFEQMDDDMDGVKAFLDLLQVLDGHMGPTTGRYSKERIHIEIRRGDKHEELKPLDNHPSLIDPPMWY